METTTPLLPSLRATNQSGTAEANPIRVGVTSGAFSAATRLRLRRRRRWVRDGIEEVGSPWEVVASTVEGQGRNEREKPKKKNGEWIMDSDGNITCCLKT